MNPYHRFHRRFIAKRQGLSAVLGGLVAGSTSSSTSSAGSQTTNGGILGEITSLFGGGSGVSTDSSAHSSTSSSPLTQSYSSSTGSKTTSHSATSTSPASATLTKAPASTPTAPDVFTSSDGTSIVYVTSTPPTASATSSPHLGFLQNPSLEGGVFALVGLIILVTIFLLVSWTIRKRRRDRLEREFAAAVSFDPGAAALYERQEEMVEKRRLSVSSSGHGHGFGYSMPQLAYAPQPEYHPQDYGQYPAYCPPPPIPYQTPPPAVLQPARQGGANLTRKFSDRKPVPPVFPEPTHGPASIRALVPPQTYQQ